MVTVSDGFNLLTADKSASIGVCNTLMDLGELFRLERNVLLEGPLCELSLILAGCLGELFDLYRRRARDAEL